MAALRELIETLEYRYRPEAGDMLHLFELIYNTKLTKKEIREKYEDDEKFRKLYKRLKDKYLDEVSNHIFSETSKYAKRRAAIYQKYADAKRLIIAGKKKAGIPVAIEVLSSAKQYGIVELALDICNELMNHFAVVEPNRRRFNNYQLQAQEYAQVLHEQTKAHTAYCRLAMELNLKVTPSQAKSDIEELKEIAKHNSHFRFRLYYYALRSLYRRAKGDNEGIVNVSEDALDYLDSCKKIMPYSSKWTFHFYMIPLLIAQGRYDTARKQIQKSKGLPERGSYNYHLTLLMQAILGLCSGRIGEASAALDEAGEEWHFQSEAVVEYWLWVQDCIKRVEGGESFEVVGTVLLAQIYGN